MSFWLALVFATAQFPVPQSPFSPASLIHSDQTPIVLCVCSVFVSGRRLCDRGGDRPGQRDTLSRPQGHLFARTQETFHPGRPLSSLVIHRRGTGCLWSHQMATYGKYWCIDLFFHQAASREVERDFNSVYSRLVLCKTYRWGSSGVFRLDQLICAEVSMRRNWIVHVWCEQFNNSPSSLCAKLRWEGPSRLGWEVPAKYL